MSWLEHETSGKGWIPVYPVYSVHVPWVVVAP